MWPRANRPAAQHEDVRQAGAEGERADADPGPGGQAARRHEPLDDRRLPRARRRGRPRRCQRYAPPAPTPAAAAGSPGATHDQNSLEPDPAGDEHRDQLEHPVGDDESEELLRATVATMIPPVKPTPTSSAPARTTGQPAHAERTHCTAIHALFVHTLAANGRGVRAVVVGEVVVDQLIDVARRQQALLDVRVVEQPDHHHRCDDDVAERRADPPPTQPVERGRETLAHERATPCHVPARATPARLRARLSRSER